MHIRVLREQNETRMSFTVFERVDYASSCPPRSPKCSWVHESTVCSCNELADATGSPDASLSDGGELLGADNAGNGRELALSEDLEVALKATNRLLFNKKETYSLGNIDNRSLLLSGGLACALGHEGPKLVKVHRGAVVLVSLIVEMSLSVLAEVAGVTIHKQISR